MTAPDSTSPAAPPGVCPRCAGTHAEDDAETGERLPCTVCFGMPLRPAGLDLDAIEALWRRACDLDTPVAVIASWRDVPLLLAEARRLRGLLDATAQAYDDLVAQVWRATGETHEPPADVAALLARVAAARREGAEAMREAFGRALAAETERLRRSGSAAEPLADAVDEVVADARRALARSGGES